MTVNAAWNVWNFRRPLVQALLSEGHRVTVIAPLDHTASELRALGCTCIDLPMDVKGLNPFADLLLLSRMRTILTQQRPDVILGYTIKSNIFGALAAKSLGLPFIPNVTGLGTAFLSSSPLQRFVEWLYRAAFRSLPVVFFQNRDDRELFVGRGLVGGEAAILVPGSGIDLRHFAPAPYPEEPTPVFLMIARLLRDKGVVEFVEAARKLKERHPEARFQLLGAADAANRSAIDLATVRGWERSHGIEYLGTSDDVRGQIAAAHCIVLPSYREGAPRTLIEAAAMARPVIATGVPGCRAVVEDRVTGLLCKPRCADSLVSAYATFLELDVAERVAMGRAGRRKVEREFDQAIVVEAYRSAIGLVTERS